VILSDNTNRLLLYNLYFRYDADSESRDLSQHVSIF